MSFSANHFLPNQAFPPSNINALYSPQDEAALYNKAEEPAVFKVKVDNLSRQASDIYLHNLFSSIGVVVATDLHFAALPIPTGYAEVSFATQDEASHALTMNGWNVGGNSIVVTPLDDNLFDHALMASFGQKPTEPEKKNLYVLNLPLDTTNDELVRLFSPYGKVSHACILAILDSCARRRGFILMGSGEEATRAMKSLHGKLYRDYCLDVSYSVVQKTAQQGYRTFEDSLNRHTRALSRARPPAYHYDSLRSMVGASLETRRQPTDGEYWNGLFQSSVDLIDGGMAESVGGGGEFRGMQLGEGRIDMGMVLVIDNLSPIVFLTADDVTPIFQCFGELTGTELFPSMSISKPNAAVVKYRYSQDAEDAKRALDGQIYGDRVIRITAVDSTLDSTEANYTGTSYQPKPFPVMDEQRFRNLSQTQIQSADRPSFRASAIPLVPTQSLPLTSSFDPFKFNSSKSIHASAATVSGTTTPSPVPVRVNRAVRISHPSHINLPYNSFPPPPHTFADTLTPREHYSTLPLQDAAFNIYPSSRLHRVDASESEASEPQSYISGEGSDAEGVSGRWMGRRASVGASTSSEIESGGKKKEKTVRIDHPFVHDQDEEDGLGGLRYALGEVGLKDQRTGFSISIREASSNNA